MSNVYLVNKPVFSKPYFDWPDRMLSGHLSCSLQQASVSLYLPRFSVNFALLPLPHHKVPNNKAILKQILLKKNI